MTFIEDLFEKCFYMSVFPGIETKDLSLVLFFLGCTSFKEMHLSFPLVFQMPCFHANLILCLSFWVAIANPSLV